MLSFLPVPVFTPRPQLRLHPSRSHPTPASTVIFCCTNPPPPPSPSDPFSDSAWHALRRRLTLLRDKEEILDRSIAHNWRSGVYTSRVVAAVGADYVRKLALHHDFLAMGTASGAVVLSHLPTGMRVVWRNVHVGQVTAVDYCEGWIASAGASDREVMVFSVAELEKGRYWKERALSGEIEKVEAIKGHRLQGHEDVVSVVRVDTRGGIVYTASLDGTVRSWEIATGKPLTVIRVGEPVFSMVVTEKGYVLAGCASGRVLAYAAARGTHLITMVCHAGHVTALDFWDETQLMVTGDSTGSMAIWSFAEAKKVGALPPHSGAVLAMRMDAGKVVSASREGLVAITRLDSLQRAFAIAGFTKYLASVAFDRTRLFSDGTNDVVACHSFDGQGGKN